MAEVFGCDKWEYFIILSSWSSTVIVCLVRRLWFLILRLDLLSFLPSSGVATSWEGGALWEHFPLICFMCDFTPQPVYLINLWNALETKTSLLGQDSQKPNQLSDCYQGSDCKVNNKHSTSWALFPGSCLRFKVIISVDLKRKKVFV